MSEQCEALRPRTETKKKHDYAAMGRKRIMFKFIIVDDEKIIRSGLAKSFDWSSIGFEPVEQFEDGKEAIEYLKNNAVDVVLTDVRMYEVSGIELAKYVFDNHPQTKVVIISGYKEFNYAQEAMRYGVCDYLLKPLDREEIRKVFLRVGEILAKERDDQNRSSTLPFQYFDESAYKEIVSYNNQLVAAVVAGAVEEAGAIHKNWFSLIDAAPKEILFFAIHSVIEEIYIRFSRMDVYIEERFDKDIVLGQLSNTETKDLFKETGKLISNLCQSASVIQANPEDRMILKAKQYIDRHLSENFSVEDVARCVYLSSSYFSREFKNRTGENAIDYIIRCRMEKAVELAESGRYTATEICKMVGYTDKKYFNRSFKKFTGRSVEDYQNHYQLGKGKTIFYGKEKQR